MGSSLKTSLQKPATIIETAFSVEMPRWRREKIGFWPILDGEVTEPGHGPLTEQPNMAFTTLDAAEVSARLLGALGSAP